MITTVQNGFRLHPLDDTYLSVLDIVLELELNDNPELGVGVRFSYQASEAPYRGYRRFDTPSRLYPLTGSLCSSRGLPDGSYHLHIDGYYAPSRHLGTGTSSFVWRWLYDALPPDIRDRFYLSGKIVPGDAGDDDPDNWVRKCRLWGGLMGLELPVSQRGDILKLMGKIQPISIAQCEKHWEIQEIS